MNHRATATVPVPQSAWPLSHHLGDDEDDDDNDDSLAVSALVAEDLEVATQKNDRTDRSQRPQPMTFGRQLDLDLPF